RLSVGAERRDVAFIGELRDRVDRGADQRHLLLDRADVLAAVDEEQHGPDLAAQVLAALRDLLASLVGLVVALGEHGVGQSRDRALASAGLYLVVHSK